jgi:hypothetical protein
MAAPKGNKFWQQRSKHGRDKLFASPELLWKAAKEYFTLTDNRKWVKKDWVGKDAYEVLRETETPYTLTGLCLYLNCNRGYFGDFKKTCNEDFSLVISRVEDIMYTQKFEGASVGAFNANIISRELGLVDKSEVKTEVRLGKDLADEEYT